MRSSFWPRAERMITGTRVGHSLSARQISKPSAPCGSIRSRRSRSGVNRFTDGSASWPLSHVSTTKPSYSRLSRSSLAMALSSSMIRMRLAMARSRASTEADRERHVDFRSRAHRTADLDHAAMALDDTLRDRKAEPAAADRDVGAPIEAFENPREVPGGDSVSAIPDGQRDAPGSRRARDGQAPFSRRVLDRVVHDVVERLDHRGSIDGDLR